MSQSSLSQIAKGHAQPMQVPAVAAGGATIEHPIFTNPFTDRQARLLRVRLIPQVSSTGNTTNRKNLNVISKGTAGIGTAEIGNLDLVTGTDLTAFDESIIDVTDTVIAIGGTATLEVEQVGAGVAVGPFQVICEFEPAGV